MLTNWAQAYGTRQIDAVKSVQPLSPQEAKELAITFGQVTGYLVSVDLAGCKFPSDNRATVTAVRHETKIQDNQANVSTGLLTTFIMEKQSKGWKIVKNPMTSGQ